MANKYYVPGEDRAAKVGDLFARVAPRYDLINDLQSFGMHRLWKRKMLKLAGVQSGCKALDLCCGSGDIAFALQARDAEVVGCDFSVRRTAGRYFSSPAMSCRLILSPSVLAASCALASG